MELHVDYHPPKVLDWEIGGGTAPLTAYEPIPSACAAGTDDDSCSEVYWRCSKCNYSEYISAGAKVDSNH